MKASGWILLFLASLAITTEASTRNEVRVWILSVLAPNEMTVTVLEPSTAFVRFDGDSGAHETVWPNHNPIRVRLQNGKLISDPGGPAAQLEISCSGGCSFLLEIPGRLQREYLGDLILSAANNMIIVVLQVEIEDLTGSILVSEMSGLEQPEALRAFAVLSRTFLFVGNRHPEQHADVCDTTHCQVYQGRSTSPDIEHWVASTEGLMLLYRSMPFQPYYSRSCGGTTATHQDVWGLPSPDYPYSSVSCPCVTAPHAWTYDLTSNLLAKITGISQPTMTRTDSNRLLVRNSSQVVNFLPETFRILSGRIIGWDKIRSNRFEVEPLPSGYRLQGTGYGHGTGFCQYGAYILAKQGKSYEQILSHYFPNAEIGESSPNH